MKLALSYIFYYLGEFLIRVDRQVRLYPLYNWLMVMSVRLDTKCVLWKRVGVEE